MRDQKSKYPNLYKRPRQEWWTYRKFSSIRGKEFVITLTGVSSEAKAYAVGRGAFDEWLTGKAAHKGSPSSRIEDLAMEVLNSKTAVRPATRKSARSVILNHIIPSFGHLSPDQVTHAAWADHIAKVQESQPESGFFNTRKYLLQILRHAKAKGLLMDVPKFKIPDSDPAPPNYLTRQEIRAILHECSPEIRLLLFIAWKHGARPGEILQYRWSMIKWKQGESGTIYIPGSITKTKRSRAIPINSRVSRVLKWLRRTIESSASLGDADGQIRSIFARRIQSDFIFPSRTDPNRHRSMLRNGWADTLKRASCRLHRCAGECKHPQIEAIMYNLRDTFITDKLSQGTNSTFVAKYVDSSTKEIEKRYAVQIRTTMEEIAG